MTRDVADRPGPHRAPHPTAVRPRRAALLLAAAVTLAGGTLVAPSAPAAPARAASRAAAIPSAATCTSTPFTARPSAGVWYRIPAVVTTASGALVAFAERRDRALGDLGDFDTVTARSTNGGCTWSSPQVVGSDGENRVSNPVPVVDATTGDVLLFSVVTPRDGTTAHKGLYLQRSTDDGSTFSALLANRIVPTGGYHGGLTGPGHAIQLTRSHVGRLLVPMGYKLSNGHYGAYGVYSDDHGSTWKIGYNQVDVSTKHPFIEGTAAELPDGRVFISYRERIDNAKAGTVRQVAYSSDGGRTLDAVFARSSLKIVSVQGSALNLSGAQSNKLLFSAPADRTKNLRRDMTIFVSRTAGATWSRRYQVQLESRPGSYSDLVQIDDATVGILYETGTKTWKERIAFASIAIPDLSDPPLAHASLTHRVADRTLTPSRRARVKVRVSVAGISSPPGKVSVSYRRTGRAGRKTVTLTFSNKGRRYVTLPRLPKGTYRLTVIYSGTGRIAATSMAAGTVKISK